jgi:hypothetical protein
MLKAGRIMAEIGHPSSESAVGEPDVEGGAGRTSTQRPSTSTANGAQPVTLRAFIEYATVIVSVLAAIAYLLGTMSMSAFASEFGVAPRDLDVDFRDQVVLFVVNLVFVLILVAISAIVSQAFFDAKGTVRNIFMFIIVLSVGAIGGILSAIFNVDFITFLITVWVAQALVSWILNERPTELKWNDGTRGWWLRAGMLAFALIIALGANAMRSASSWGSELRSWAHDCQVVACPHPPLGPPGLALIFEPTVGTATSDDGTDCVVRISPRVFVGEMSVAVVPTSWFEARDCVVSRRPFLAPSGDVKVYGLTAVGVSDVEDGSTVELIKVDGQQLYLAPSDDRMIVVNQDDISYEFELDNADDAEDDT